MNEGWKREENGMSERYGQREQRESGEGKGSGKKREYCIRKYIIMTLILLVRHF